MSVTTHTNLVLATKEEVEAYRVRASAFVEASHLWNSCKSISRSTVMEYIANSEGKTVFGSMVGKNSST